MTTETLRDPTAPAPQGVFFSTLRRLFGFTVPYRTMLIVSIVLAVAAQAFSIAVPWLTGDLIDEAIRPRDEAALRRGIVLIVIAAALRFVLMTARRLIAGTMAVSLEYDIRNAVYTQLQRLSFSFFDRNQTGQLMSRATSDVGAVRIFMSYGLLFLTQYVLTIVAVLIALFATDPLLALVALAATPFLALVAYRYSQVSHPVITQAQQAVAQVTTQAEEAVSGVRVVKVFGQEARERERFDARVRTLLDRNLAATRLRALYVPALGSIPSAIVAAVLLVGGLRVIDRNLTLGEFVAFSGLLTMLVMPLRALGMWVGQAQRAVSSGLRVLELLDLEPSIADAPGAPALPAGRGRVTFEQVTFGYEDGRTVLRDIDLEIPAGQTVALIGPTGCGKTTLAALVPRFYDASDGRVLLDGTDVRAVPLDDLRRAVAVIAEETFLFSTTVRDNIAFGRPGATDEDVREAARRAQADGFIATLPDGYDTVVGERGLTLSGGQRQRIAIARALLCDPRVLILDDATASVDATTEARIRAGLRELMANRTTIIIGHRLSTIALADRIVVLDAGRVVADGSVEEVRETSSVYREIERHGLLDQAFVTFDGDVYVPPKEGADERPARPAGRLP